MSNWYDHAMPTIKDVTPHVDTIAQAIKNMPGVKAVYITGSILQQKPNYPIKDLDVIAETIFDSGDLMAIDAGEDSPLRMPADELEDFGFNPDAVKFTKAYTGLRDYNVDHWVTSSDNKVLHWGLMPETIEEWKEVHEDAETYASKITGYNRLKLAKQTDVTRRHWQEAYTLSAQQAMSERKIVAGWYPSSHPATEMLLQAKKVI